MKVSSRTSMYAPVLSLSNLIIRHILRTFRECAGSTYDGRLIPYAGSVYNGHLIQILRVAEMLIYALVNSAFVPLKSYYLSHSSHVLEFVQVKIKRFSIFTSLNRFFRIFD